MPPRALVTGATGCIGANVAAALLAWGYDVRAMRRIASSLEALNGLLQDICFPSKLVLN